jgi:EAL domain-containing protein (putative c-di-GMP-specific phosphodiesterase class I)
MEGLVRWHVPGARRARARLLLEAAAAAGQLPAIEEWVLRTGAAEAAHWQGLRGGARQLRLNVSTAQLRSPGFYDLVADVVAEHRLLAGALGLEVSEQTLLELGDDAPEVLTEVQAAGAAVAVDDTTFYATLAVIEHLPVDVVKLGQRHVRGVDLGDSTLVETVVHRAHARGLVVVAQGVETWGRGRPADRDRLRQGARLALLLRAAHRPRPLAARAGPGLARRRRPAAAVQPVRACAAGRLRPTLDP